jgi:S-disulfanyl-L-cysteine oxidoreductase SoxD
MKRLIVFAATASLVAVVLRPHAPAQAQLDRASRVVALSSDGPPAAHTTWDSVFTDSQAVRGDTLYKATCMKCHGATLAGSDSAVSLTGNDFQVNWDGLTLDQLYDKMLTSMPSDNPKSVPSSKMIDILAYMLSKNSFPSGKMALPDDVAVLKDIKFAKNKP